jgi:hypothetical protein
MWRVLEQGQPVLCMAARCAATKRRVPHDEFALQAYSCRRPQNPRSAPSSCRDTQRSSTQPVRQDCAPSHARTDFSGNAHVGSCGPAPAHVPRAVPGSPAPCCLRARGKGAGCRSRCEHGDELDGERDEPRRVHRVYLAHNQHGRAARALAAAAALLPAPLHTTKLATSRMPEPHQPAQRAQPPPCCSSWQPRVRCGSS